MLPSKGSRTILNAALAKLASTMNVQGTTTGRFHQLNCEECKNRRGVDKTRWCSEFKKRPDQCIYGPNAFRKSPDDPT